MNRPAFSPAPKQLAITCAPWSALAPSFRILLRAFAVVSCMVAFGLGRSHASHLSGGEISYTCLGGNNYQFTVTLFRDCSGINIASTPSLNVTSPCGNMTLATTQTTTDEVSQLCPQDLGSSTCNGGNLPGTTRFVFTTAAVNLANCDVWTASWNSAAEGTRNGAVLNLVDPSNQNMFFSTTVNTLAAPCDNGPVLQSAPIPYVCLNTPVSYSFGAIDPDGDALTYAFLGAQSGAGVAILYNAGFSANSPVSGITLNSSTGEVNFTPTQVGSFVVVVAVQSRNGNGVLIGTTVRDMQFVVVPCAGTPPDPNAGAVSNLTGNAQANGANDITLCGNGSFCFTAVYTDADAASSLILESNIAQVLPGATVMVSGSNPLSAIICWNGDPNISGTVPFNVTISDCSPGSLAILQNYSYTVTIIPTSPMTLTVSNDTTVRCAGQPATVALLNIAGGAAPFTTTWTDAQTSLLSNALNMQVIVDQDASYTVTVTDACADSASATVNTFAPQYAPMVLSLTEDTVLCNGGSLLLEAEVAGGSGIHTFLWSGMNTNDSTVLVSITESNTFTVQATDLCGEVLSASVTVGVETPVTNITAISQGQDEWLFTSASTPSADQFDWNFGDGNTSTETQPNHRYLDTEFHVVELTITTANGCTASDTVHIAPAAHVYFPNAFTPDGDGINDVFGAVGHELSEVSFIVFDRWGAQVFASSAMDQGWDGRTANGSIAPTGVYVFRFHVKGERLPATEGIGHVTLLGSETAAN
ncbi:MAG: gliding motility-associated C-terminal domain-containing protein [Flavobacteriales bacterium]|jgi:gliding motility-associated-like protein|nr:gliding motility-associated C-terminal domain-containing protein [Flavobacteriales bacterium]MBK9076207.1 gliding motility-associated C-terminal domain-containing protein [Flavobacteriales bacterium]MBK9540573.1 gliding motility-associated C-terminal domain-containing protein [Flavobacteriales bacterium]